MDQEGQGGILLSLGDGEELFPQGERRCVIPSHCVKCPQPKQDLRDLERLPHLQTEILRSGVGVFHFGGTYPFVAINEAPRLSWRVSSWRALATVSGKVLSNARAAVRWLMASAFAECRAACCPARLRYSTAFAALPLRL